MIFCILHSSHLEPLSGIIKFEIESDDLDAVVELAPDDEAQAIVKRLEEKYGNAKESSRNKRKNIRFAPEDVVDKSVGYDLTDTFIDDSQAYDEWVPSTMDTAKSGHYVNKGPLKFRQFDSEDEEEDSNESDESVSSEEMSDDEEEEEEEDDDCIVIDTVTGTATIPSSLPPSSPTQAVICAEKSLRGKSAENPIQIKTEDSPSAPTTSKLIAVTTSSIASISIRSAESLGGSFSAVSSPSGKSTTSTMTAAIRADVSATVSKLLAAPHHHKKPLSPALSSSELRLHTTTAGKLLKEKEQRKQPKIVRLSQAGVPPTRTMAALKSLTTIQQQQQQRGGRSHGGSGGGSPSGSKSTCGIINSTTAVTNVSRSGGGGGGVDLPTMTSGSGLSSFSLIIAHHQQAQQQYMAVDSSDKNQRQLRFQQEEQALNLCSTTTFPRQRDKNDLFETAPGGDGNDGGGSSVLPMFAFFEQQQKKRMLSASSVVTDPSTPSTSTPSIGK